MLCLFKQFRNQMINYEINIVIDLLLASGTIHFQNRFI